VTAAAAPASSRAPQNEKRKLTADRPAVVFSPGTAPVTLTDGTGDRSLSVKVDSFGAFGSETSAGDATYDPVGSIPASGTVYQSAVYLSNIQGYLSSDFGPLPTPTFTNVTATSAQSSFNAGQLSIALTQSVTRTSAGSGLVQSYRITNAGTSQISFVATRHLDGDLKFDGSFSSDFGGVSPDGRTLFEYDAGDDPSSASTFVGITDSGGTPAGYAIQPYPFIDQIAANNGIPASVLNTVFNDANGDRVTDSSFDVTLSLASSFTLAPNASVVYTTTTRFGDQTLTPRATLDWDEPDQNAGALPPPQHLRALPLGSTRPADEADVVRRPNDTVTGYNVYTSPTSPVATTPENFFTSVPATQTSANVPTTSGGSFFVVTATYAGGESGPSNEASADVPAATLTSVKVTATKIAAKGSGFTSTVSVFIDGIPFAAAPKVKGSTKVVQKGTLITGQTIGTYLAAHSVVLIQFRNSNGGIASKRYPN
jgi:hypothetical protein